MYRPLALVAVIVLAGCSTPTRQYRLEIDPLPQGSQRQVNATLLVGGKPEVIDGSLPLVREWTATSLSGELTSPGAGGLRLRLIAKPEKSIQRELMREESGPHGVTARIIERSGEETWGLQLDMAPIPAPVPAPAAAPAPVPAAAP